MTPENISLLSFIWEHLSIDFFVHHYLCRAAGLEWCWIEYPQNLRNNKPTTTTHTTHKTRRHCIKRCWRVILAQPHLTAMISSIWKCSSFPESWQPSSHSSGKHWEMPFSITRMSFECLPDQLRAPYPNIWTGWRCKFRQRLLYCIYRQGGHFLKELRAYERSIPSHISHPRSLHVLLLLSRCVSLLIILSFIACMPASVTTHHPKYSRSYSTLYPKHPPVSILQVVHLSMLRWGCVQIYLLLKY